MLVTLLLATASASTPFGGVEWRPLSRADLTWVDDGRTSGVVVGEFDGTVRPNLQAFAGAWVSDRAAVSGSLGMARLQNTTNVNDVVRQLHWGVVRPGLDFRWAFHDYVEDRPWPWFLLGMHADIPSARDVSTGYTRAEQAAADEGAWIERAKLGGVGGRVGLGADYEVLPGLALGAQWAVEWHHATWYADDISVATQWLAADASLMMIFRWPEPAP